MEDYNRMRESSNGHRPGTHFLYASTNSSGFGRIQNDANTHNNGGGSNGMAVGGVFHGQCLQSSSDHASVKTESTHNTTGLNLAQKLRLSFHGGNEVSSADEDKAIKAKIIAHPQYSGILQAYMDCQKIGAPPEVVTKMAAVRQEFESRHRSSSTSDAFKDPELDQFMEAYYDMLVKYREEMTRPLQEAMDFMRRVETQLNMLSNAPVRIFNSTVLRELHMTAEVRNKTLQSYDKGSGEGGGSSEEEQDNLSGGETEGGEIDPRAEDRELKNHLLRKYSGYLSSLKQELSKKKKKGKLPKEARQKLLSWWELHYKWPYPSETEKLSLAESTGLDQKQINNWFINQRKRHWKPSEDMQFMVMDGLHPQNLYIDGGAHYIGDGPYRLGP